MGKTAVDIFANLIKKEEAIDLPVDAIRSNTSDYVDVEEKTEEKKRKKRIGVSTKLKAGMPVKITKTGYSVSAITLWLLNNSECAVIEEKVDNVYEVSKQSIWIENGWTEVILLYLSLANHVYGENAMIEMSQWGIFNEHFYLDREISTKLDIEVNAGIDYHKVPNSDWYLVWNGDREHLGRALLVIIKHLGVVTKNLRFKLVNLETYENLHNQGLSVANVFGVKATRTRVKNTKKEDLEENLEPEDSEDNISSNELLALHSMVMLEKEKLISEIISDIPESFYIKAIRVDDFTQPISSTAQAIIVMLVYAITLANDENEKHRVLEKLAKYSIKDMCGITKDQDEIDRYHMKIATYDVPNSVYTLYVNNILKFQLEYIEAIAKELRINSETYIIYDSLDFRDSEVSEDDEYNLEYFE